MSAFSRAPDEIEHAVARAYGAWWIVGICDDKSGHPALSVAVSESASSVDVIDGQLRYSPVGGTEILAVGVPDDWEGALPVLPESAVQEAAGRMKRPLARLPRLVAGPLGEGMPQTSCYVMSVAAAIRVATAGAPSSTRALDTEKLSFCPTRARLGRVPSNQEKLTALVAKLNNTRELTFSGARQSDLEARIGTRGTSPLTIVQATVEKREIVGADLEQVILTSESERTP